MSVAVSPLRRFPCRQNPSLLCTAIRPGPNIVDPSGLPNTSGLIALPARVDGFVAQRAAYSLKTSSARRCSKEIPGEQIPHFAFPCPVRLFLFVRFFLSRQIPATMPACTTPLLLANFSWWEFPALLLTLTRALCCSISNPEASSCSAGITPTWSNSPRFVKKYMGCCSPPLPSSPWTTKEAVYIGSLRHLRIFLPPLSLVRPSPLNLLSK